MPGSFYTPWGAGANLIGAMLFLLLLGFYLCLLITTGVILHSKGARMSLPVLALIALFVIMMTTAAITPVSLYHAYVTSPDGPTVYWAMYTTMQIDKSLGTINNFCFSLSTIIADAVLLWRMYIVWDRNRYTLIFPAISYVVCVPGSFVSCGVALAISLHGPKPEYTRLYEPLTILGLANAIVLCWYTTGMICGRLWYMRKQIMRYNDRPNPYGRIIMVLVESGAMYSVCMLMMLLFLFVPSEIGGYAETVMINICSAVVAISPTLVVLRLSLGHLQPSDAKDTLGTTHFQRPQVRAEHASTAMTGASINFAPRPRQGVSFVDSTPGAEEQEAKAESPRDDMSLFSIKSDRRAAQGDVEGIEIETV